MDNAQQTFLDFHRAIQQGFRANALPMAHYPVAFWVDNTLTIIYNDPDNVNKASIRTMHVTHATSPDDETIAILRSIVLHTSGNRQINIGLPYPIPKDVAESGVFNLCVKDSDGNVRLFREMNGDLSCTVSSPTLSAQKIGYGRA